MQPRTQDHPDVQNEPARRAWQRMLSGRRLDLLNPSPLDIEIEDIAHGLARLARWNGQTLGDHSFSVAQHSLVVEDIVVALYPDAPRTWRLTALLHDSPEYVIGDLISPFKAAMGHDYKQFEQQLLEVIHTRFGLPERPPVTVAKLIKRADKIAAYFEAIALAGFSEKDAEKFIGAPAGLDTKKCADLKTLRAMPAPEAQLKFMKQFDNITN